MIPKSVSSTLEALTPEHEEELLTTLEQSEAKDNPFSLIEDGHLKIKSKAGKIIPLIPNKAQRFVLNEIKSLWDKNKIIRIYILKARQLGISTLVEAIIYSLTSQTENISADIIADELKRSNNLFEMSKFFHEKVSTHLQPKIKKSNEKKLEFDKIHSQILVETSGDKDAGRSFTFQIVHLSEYARFKNVSDLMLGLSHTVPPLPHTMIFKETTANGFNFAKDEWDKALNGETNYLALFIPWYWGEDYLMPVDGSFEIGDDEYYIGTKNYGYITKDEYFLESLMQAEGITQIKERLNWRRWDIVNNCEGNILKFNQENPATAEEAFVASGDCAFNKEVLTDELKTNAQPIGIGNLVELDGKVDFRSAKNGDFKIYGAKVDNEEYVIGGDACSGSGLDWASLIAIGKRSNDTIATLRLKIDGDELAQKARLLGLFLNQAEVGIENDKYGFQANIKLRETYGKVFMQETIHTDTKKVIQRFGWETNAKTRPEMIGQLKEEIRQRATSLKDRNLILECLTFIKNPENGKEEAQEGCFLKGTRVLTNEGYENIENIKEGDYVYTHKGILQPVTKTFKRIYNGLIYDVKISGVPSVFATEEHPFECYKNSKRQWLPVKDLREKDKVILPKRRVERNLILSDRQLYVMGLWLAEGSTKQGKCIQFNFGINEVDLAIKVKDLIDNLTLDDTVYVEKHSRRQYGLKQTVKGYAYKSRKNGLTQITVRKNKNTIQVSKTNKFLHDFFVEHLGKLCYKKKLSKELFNSTNLLPLVAGLIDGDGCQRYKNPYDVNLSLTSRNLIEQVKQILIDYGIYCTYQKSAPKNKRKLYTLNIKHQHARKILEYSLKLRKYNMAKPNCHAKDKGKYFTVPVRKLTRKYYTGYVYNMEVCGDNSYIVEGVSVHNCHDDMVIARAIAGAIRRRRPYTPKDVTTEIKQRIAVREIKSTKGKNGGIRYGKVKVTPR